MVIHIFQFGNGRLHVLLVDNDSYSMPYAQVKSVRALIDLGVGVIVWVNQQVLIDL